MPPETIDEQCAAVTTWLGVTSVPVHWNARSIVMCATNGYSPGEASLPPTIACAGAVMPTHRASVARRRRREFMLFATSGTPGSGGANIADMPIARVRDAARRRIEWRRHRGDAVHCPVCDRGWDSFKDDWNRPDALCWRCG